MAAVVATGGLRASPLLIVPALAGAVLCLAALRPVAEPGPPAAGSANKLRLTDDWRSFSRLSGAVVCRSAVFVGLSTFIAVYVRERTAGGELAGPAALFLRAVLAAHHPGQDYLPGRAGTAAGVTLGLAVSVGGIASPVIGALADATSLRTALVPLIALPRSAHSCCARCASPGPPAPRRRRGSGFRGHDLGGWRSVTVRGARPTVRCFAGPARSSRSQRSDHERSRQVPWQ